MHAAVSKNIFRVVCFPPAKLERGPVGDWHAIWQFYWIYGNMGVMKTTLELPDGLMQRVKIRAVHRNQKLKDAIAQLLELGMAVSQDGEKSLRAPRPMRVKSGRLNIGDIEAAIAAGRE